MGLGPLFRRHWALLLLLLTLAPALFANVALTTCANLNTASTTYDLQNSIGVYNGTGACFNISATGVVLDGHNFFITGGNGTSSVGVNITNTSATVQNLNIGAFQYGILANMTAVANNATNTVNNVTINVTYNGGTGINFVNGNFTVVNATTVNSTVNKGVGINSTSSNNVTVANSTLISTGSSTANVIWLATTSQNWTIFNNSINASAGGRGIYLQASTSNFANISFNNINVTGGGYDILFSSSNNTVTNNTLYIESQVGLYLSPASNNTFTNNTVTGSGTAADIITSNSNTFSGNTFKSSTQYEVQIESNSILNVFTNNTFNTNGNQHAMYISSNNNTLTNNTFAGDSATGAFYLSGGSNNIIANNTISDTGSGDIAFYSDSPSFNTTLANNTILGGTSKGVQLGNKAQNWTIFNNTISSSGGSFVFYSSQLKLSNVSLNTFTATGAGTEAVNLTSSLNSNNTFTNNTISSALAIALDIDATAKNNTFYWNNFSAGSVLVHNAGDTTNQFNTTVNGVAQGNYYSDIAILALYDSDGDGYGDEGALYPYNAAHTANFTGNGADNGPHFARLDPSITSLSTCANLSTVGQVYLLSASFTYSGGTCFNVTAANVTLNGAGYSVTGNDAGNSIGVNVTAYNATVKSLTVTSFQTGIQFNTTSQNSNNVANGGLVNGVTVNVTKTAGTGISFLAGNATIVNGTTINVSVDSGYGINSTSSNNITVSNGSVYTSGASAIGINLASSSQNWTIFNNTVNTSGTTNAYDIYLADTTTNFATISFNTINATDHYGVYLNSGSSNNTVANNTINATSTTANAYALFVKSGSNNTVANNTVSSLSTSGSSNGAISIYLSSASNNTVANNTVTATTASTQSQAYSIAIVSASNNTVNNNTFTTTATAGSTGLLYNAFGIYVASTSNNNTITNNTAIATSAAGSSYAFTVYLSASSNNTMTNNTLNATTGKGLYVLSTSNLNFFTNNTVNVTGNSGIAIQSDDGNNNTLANNTITTTGSSSYGIYLTASSQNWTIFNNSIKTSGTSGYGIYLAASTVLFNNISSNTINTTTGFGYGIYLNPGVNNTITNNTILTSSNNAHGIYLSSTTQNNTIANNSVNTSGSGAYGIYSDNAGNRFNQILSNTINLTNVNSYGIYLFPGSNNTVANNTIYSSNSNSFAIYLASTAQNNTIANNSINTSGISGHGVYLNGTGVRFNTFTSNTINVTGSLADAINITPGHNNTFTSNTISSESAITLDIASFAFNNTFYYNNFTKGSVYIRNSADTTNTFNTSTGASPNVAQGNYYSDIATLDIYDSNADTYGDTGGNYPYSVNSTSKWVGVGGDWGPKFALAYGNQTITTCRNLAQSNMNYTLSASFSYSGGTCFNITAANVTLQGGNFFALGNDASKSVGVNITALSAIVQNLQIQGFDRGIQLNNSLANNATINNVSINVTRNVGVGIDFLLANFTMVNGTTINASATNTTGINSSTSHNNTVANSTINMVSASNIAPAIYLASTSQNWTIINNTINTSGSAAQGIILGSGTMLNLVANNTINVTGTTVAGILLVTSGTNVFFNNTIYAIKGIGMNITLASENNSITNSTINSSQGQGIYIDASRNNTIANSTFNTTTGAAILFNSSVNFTWILNNTINTTGAAAQAIVSISGNNDTIANNSIVTVGARASDINITATGQNWSIINNTLNTTGATSHGIELSAASVQFANISLNRINVTNTNSIGINLITSANNTIERNKIYAGQGIGINLTLASNNNSLTNNTINTTIGQGIYLSNVRNVTIANGSINTTTGSGIYFNSTSNLSWVLNNTINTSGIGGGAINGTSGHNNTVANNTIFTAGTDAVGINLSGLSNNWTITNNSINTSGAEAHGIWINVGTANRTNITFNTINVTGARANAINLSITNNNNITNNTLSSETAIALDISANGNQTQVYYNNFTKGSVLIRNSGNANTFNTSTGASPNVAQGNYYSDIATLDIYDSDADTYGDTGGAYPYSANWTVLFVGSGGDWGPKFAPAFGNTTLSTCRKLNASNMNYTISASFTYNGGTCFNITAANVSLNGAGYGITGNNAANSIGVNVSAISASIQNLNITKFAFGIQYNGSLANNGSINNVTINVSANNGAGIYLPNANFTIINGTTINTTSTSGHGIYSIGTVGANNITMGNSTIVTTGSTAHGIYLKSNSQNWTIQNVSSTTGLTTSYAIYLADYTDNNTLITNVSANTLGSIAVNFTSTSNLTLNSSFIYSEMKMAGVTNSAFTNLSLIGTTGSYCNANIIWMANSNSNNFSNTSIENYGHLDVNCGNYAFTLRGSSNNTFTNITYGDWFGYFLYTGSNSNNITGNMFDHTMETVLYTSGSNNTFFYNNTIPHGAAGGEDTVSEFISASPNNVGTIIANNSIQDPLGIWLPYAQNWTFSNNTITAFGAIGMYLDSTSAGVNITNNNFSIGFANIVLNLSATNISLTGNNISSAASIGVMLNATTNVSVSNSNLTSTTGAALVVAGTNSANTVYNNTINTTTGAGILLKSSANFTNVSLNVINVTGASANAVNLSGANNNTFTNNTLSSETAIAVDISASSQNNSFYYNNFTKGSKFVRSAEPGVATTTLNTTVNGKAQGNWYADLSLLNIYDSDGDGYGDAGSKYPYNSTFSANISGNITDWGPLIPATILTTCTNLSTANTFNVISASFTYNGGTCFNITAANVSLNGNNFFILGDNSSLSVGVNITNIGATVKNLQIQGFDRGIQLNNSLANNATINNVSINVTRNVGIGINFILANFTMVNGTTINVSVNNGMGINSSASNNITIANSTINTFSGSGTAHAIDLAATSQNWTIFNNTINTSSTSANGIEMAASTVLFANISLNTINTTGSSAYGIHIFGSNNTINNNTITSSVTAIGMDQGTPQNNTIANNSLKVTSFGSGVLGGLYVATASARFNQFLSNTINSSSGPSGVKLSSASNNTFANNTIITTSSSAYGFWLTSTSQNNTIANNTINTSGSSANAVYINNAGNRFNLIANNTINVTGTGYPVYLSPGSNNTIQNNTIYTSQNNAYAIILDTTSQNNTITNNSINTSGNAHGIYISDAGSRFNQILSNTVNTTNSGNAIYLSLGVNLTVANNTLYTSKNGAYGIEIDSLSQNNTIANNSINTSGTSAHGLYFNGNTANQTNVSGNVINVTGTSAEAINISGANNNTFTNNTLSSETAITVDIKATAQNNTFYWNNFTKGSLFIRSAEPGTATTALNTTAGGVAEGNWYADLSILAIYDADSTGYGVSGAKYPYNSTNTANISGNITDYGPHFARANSRSAIYNLSLIPTSPTVTSILQCNVTVRDTDNATLSLNYSWLRNGTNQTTLAGYLTVTNDTAMLINLTLSSSITNKNDNWSCQAMANDTISVSSTNQSNNATVANSAPTAISNLKPNGGETFSGSSSNNISINWTNSTDADSDTITYQILYSADSGTTWTSIANTTSNPYYWNSSATASLSTYRIRIYANDSSAVSSNVSSASDFTIQHNTAPNIYNLSITPASPTVSSTLQCNVTSRDAEQSSLTLNYSWLRNGANQSALAGTTSITNNTAVLLNVTLNNSAAAKGDNWSCQVYANDGSLNSTVNTSSNVTLVNSLPVITLLNLTDSTQYANVACRATVTDGDGHADLSSVNFTLTKPDGTKAVNNVAGTYVGSDVYNSTTFNLSIWGQWNCSITAVDTSAASVTLNGSFTVIREWQKYYGGTLGQLRLGSGVSNFLVNWSATHGQTVFVAEPTVNVNFTYLYPLGVCPNGSLHTGSGANDFTTADTELGLTSASSRTISGLFDTDNNAMADANQTIPVFGRNVSNVSVARISSLSPFYTGIFWQGSQGSNTCFNGVQDLVFAVKINQSAAGLYGTSDYELMIPQELASYKNASNNLVAFYGEYRGQ